MTMCRRCIPGFVLQDCQANVRLSFAWLLLPGNKEVKRFVQIGTCLGYRALRHRDDPAELEVVRKDVAALCARFPAYPA